jgi:phosphoenolpyruvate carboxykinase (GTP)
VDGGIGLLPRPKDLDTAGLAVGPEELRALLSVDRELWLNEVAEMRAYLARFGERLPAQLWAELDKTAAALGGAP